jgi:hypothetical protein
VEQVREAILAVLEKRKAVQRMIELPTHCFDCGAT